MVNRLSDIGIERLRAAAEQVGGGVGARLVVLFGSVARGDPAADIDIAVLPARGETLDCVAVTNKLIQALSVQAVDVSDLSHAEPVLMMVVARDGIPLYEAKPGEFASFTSLAARRFADTRKFRVAENQEIHEYLAERRTAS